MKTECPPIVRSRAPLRLSFAGGGTELSPYLDIYGGQVLNATINLHAYATLQLKPGGDRVSFCATDGQKTEVLEPATRLEIAGDLPLHRGVYNRMVRDFNDGRPLPLTLTTFCEAPVGSGLGSSSTLTVAIIKAFDEAMGLALGEYEVARLAYEIERQELDLKGGSQDQYAAAFGGFNFIEFQKEDRVIVNPLRVRDWIVSELEASLLLYFTGTSRESANIIVEQTQRLRDQDADTIERLHKIKAHATVMKEYLLKGQLSDFGVMLDQAWQDKKETAKSVSNAEIDAVYAKARAAGVIGGKISGAGGGGFMMLVCDPMRRMDVVRMLEAEAGTLFACKFVFDGARSWRIQGN